MSALALYCIDHGIEVSGSDREESDITRMLRSKGATVYIGHKSSNVGRAQLVVYTQAVSQDNAELQVARKCGVRAIPRSEFLGEIVNSFEKSVAIAGTHGKTTVTSMLSHVLCSLSVVHTAFIGGISNHIHGNYMGGGTLAVAEACEFRRSFLQLKPSVAVVLNVQYDHPDCYSGLKDVYRAFKKFCDGADKVLVNADDKFASYIANAVTYGIEKGHYRAEDVTLYGKGRYKYTFTGAGDKVEVRLGVAGHHQVYNSLAVMSVCDMLGLPLLQCCHAIARFTGTDRRWTEICDDPVKTIVDYAHHPAEISASLSTARDCGYKKILAVFQPHTYSRTKALAGQFATSLSQADEVVLLPVYSARESYIRGGDSRRLYRLLKGRTKVLFAEDFNEAVSLVTQNIKAFDAVLILGAGNVYKLGEEIFARLKDISVPH